MRRSRYHESRPVPLAVEPTESNSASCSAILFVRTPLEVLRNPPLHLKEKLVFDVSESPVPPTLADAFERNQIEDSATSLPSWERWPDEGSRGFKPPLSASQSGFARLSAKAAELPASASPRNAALALLDLFPRFALQDRFVLAGRPFPLV